MAHTSINHTIIRNGIYYVSFHLSGKKYFRKSLETDSHTQAHLLISFASPVIPLVQRGTIHSDQFGERLSVFSNRLKKQSEHWLVQQFLHNEQSNIQPMVVQEYRETVTPAAVTNPQKQNELKELKEVLTLAGAWNIYKKEKTQNWTKVISQANERFMEVLLIILGVSTDVTTITKQDIKQVMEVVENLPKRVVQRYRSMTIQQLIEFINSEVRNIGCVVIFFILSSLKAIRSVIPLQLHLITKIAS
ncbi:Uncharacterised protein [Serratia proteamaculans]|nr:hypothetical protein [Serratia proteamaculans]CAI1972272.1 Uncharacterised protein [Serratia proteamaculans]